MRKLWKLVIIKFLSVSVVAGQMKEGDDCQLSNGKLGVCKLILGCQAVDAITKSVFPEACGQVQSPSIKLAAPTPTPTPQPKSKPTPKPALGISRQPGEISSLKCLEYSQYLWKPEWNSSIYLGEESKKNGCPFDEVHSNNSTGRSFASRREFPHMVQLGYDGEKGPEWVCGGSLISEQYVLTAAQCVNVSNYVRMGMVDLDNEDHKQKFDIIERIPHPEYENPKPYHDIALVKLHKKVELNTWVRPACLSTFNRSPGTPVMASGWGRLTWAEVQSKILKRMIQEIYDHSHCQRIYRKELRLPQGVRDDIMICAGHPTDENGLTCAGDGGGPLQVYRYGRYSTCVYDVIGIISFGMPCGLELDIPEIYTRVSYYVQWIEDIVWPVTAEYNIL